MKHSLILNRPDAPTTIIQIRATIEGRRIKISTGVSIEPKDWDAKRERINGDPTAQAQLDKFVNGFERTVMDAIDRGEVLSAATIKEGLKRRVEGKAPKSKLTVNQWITEFMEECENGERMTKQGTRITSGRLEQYRNVHGLLFDFKRWENGGRDIVWEDINEQWVAHFIRWRGNDQVVNGELQRPAVNLNTIGRDLKILRAWTRVAFERGVHANRIAWDSDIMKVRPIATVKVHLTPEELATLATCDLSKRKRKGPQGPEATAMEVVRDMFVLACWTGARISDIKRMPDLIADAWKENGGSCPDHITFVQAKTNATVTVPTLPGARDVIEKHGGQLPRIMNEQKVNVLLKELIRVAGLDRTIQTPSTSIDKQVGLTKQLSEMVSFHTARRSFATNLYNMGVLSAGELRALTGHTTEAALMTYLNVTQTDVSKKASEKLRAAFEG